MLVKILCFQGHSTTSTSCRATLKPEQSFRSHRWSPITAHAIQSLHFKFMANTKLATVPTYL